MKKIFKLPALIVAQAVAFCCFAAGCNFGEKVNIERNSIMSDIDTAPLQQAAYESYSKAVYEEYKAVAERHTSDGELDEENEEVQSAASDAAAKLFAYACYNERTLDKYVFFSDQTGDTDLGASGSATARRQEYYLRVNESENTCGYRYHYTIKKVDRSSGLIAGSKGLFESARIRMTDKTDLLYRFEGDKSTIKYSDEKHPTLGVNLLECEWKTGKDWGKPDVVMKKSGFIPPEEIHNDVINGADDDNFTVRGNIDILAENIIKSARIIENPDGLLVIAEIDCGIANSSEASLKMLRKANDSGDCKWDDLTLTFQLWNNGLFRFYYINETWSGSLKGFKGSVNSETTYKYSYSDRDCDMSAYLETLDEAKKSKEK